MKSHGETNRKRSSIRWTVLLVCLFLLVIVPFAIWGDAITAYTKRLVASGEENRWLVGGILASLLASDIVLPIPSSIVGTAIGYLLGVVGGTLAATAGLTISCLLGYWLGNGVGRPLARRLVGEKELQRFEQLASRSGAWAVIMTRAVPVLAEMSIFLSGMGRMRPGRVLLLCLLANFGLSAVYASMGAWSAQSGSPVPAFVGSICLPGVAMLWWHWKRKQEEGER